MVTAIERPSPELGETERVIEEFKQRVIQSLEKERSKLREIAEKDAKLILTKAYQDSANLTGKAQEESLQIIESAKKQAQREVEDILAEAQQRAEQIVINAEEITRRDAKERTRKEVDNCIRNARDEAAKLVARNMQQAKEEAAGIIEQAKKDAAEFSRQVIDDAEMEAEKIIKEATVLKQQAQNALPEAQKKAEEAKEQILEAARKDAVEKAQKEAAEIVIQAKQRTEKEREYLLASTLAEGQKAGEAEKSRILMEANQEAENIIIAAKNKVRVQLEDSTRLMLEIQQKMQQVIGTAGLDVKKNESKTEMPSPIVQFSGSASVPNRERATLSPQTASTADKGNQPSGNPQNKINSIFYDDENRTYQGRLKIDIAPPVDSEQITYLEQNLLKTANINLVGKGGTEDGSAWVEIDITKPVPLVDVLKKISGVKDVVGAKSYIIIALKSKQPV